MAAPEREGWQQVLVAALAEGSCWPKPSGFRPLATTDNIYGGWACDGGWLVWCWETQAKAEVAILVVEMDGGGSG